MELIGIIFIILNIFLSIFAICLYKGKFIYIDLLLKIDMIITVSLIGCFLFPIGTIAIGFMAFDRFKSLN